MNARQFSRHRARIENSDTRSRRWRQEAMRHLVHEARAILVVVKWKVAGYRLPTGEVVCIKRRYQTEAHASLVLDNIGLTTGTHRKPVRAYPCPYCTGWHLTSREQ